MPVNLDKYPQHSPEVVESESQISDAEKLLAALERGEDPDKDIAELLRDTAQHGESRDRIVADEVGGLSIVNGVTKSDEVPILLGEQSIEELSVALAEIAEVKGDAALEVIVSEIEKADQAMPELSLGADVEYVSPEAEKTAAEYNPWLEPHKYATLAELTEGVKQSIDKIRAAVEQGGDTSLWYGADAASIHLGQMLESGEGYVPDDVARWAKQQFRAHKEAWPAIQARDKVLGDNPVNIDEQLVNFMDNTIPNFLGKMPVERLQELVHSDAYRESPLLQRAVEAIRLNVENTQEAPLNSQVLPYLKLKGYRGVNDFMLDVRSQSGEREPWQETILKNPSYLARAFFGEIESSHDKHARNREEFFRVGEFLELIGLPQEHARQVAWSLRHEDRRRVQETAAICNHIEAGVSAEQLTRLYEEAGLVALERYGSDQLRLMYNVITGDSATIERLQREEVTVVITDSTEDHNGAFSLGSDKFRTDDRTLFFEIESAEDGLVELEKCNELLMRHDIFPSTVVLGAHGSPEQTMQFGETTLGAQEILQREGKWSSVTELDELLGRVWNYGARGDGQARLILLSCSQGSREDGGVSMADAMASRMADIDIYAPDVPSNITFDYHEGTPRGLKFSEGETRRFRRDSSTGQTTMNVEETIPFRRESKG